MRWRGSWNGGKTCLGKRLGFWMRKAEVWGWGQVEVRGGGGLELV